MVYVNLNRGLPDISDVSYEKHLKMWLADNHVCSTLLSIFAVIMYSLATAATARSCNIKYTQWYCSATHHMRTSLHRS